MFTLSWIHIAIVIVGIGVLAAVTWRLAVTRPTAASTKAASIPLTLVRVTRVLAVFYAAATVIGTVTVVVQHLISDSVAVRMPVRPFWPSLPETVEISGTTAEVVGGGFDHAMVSVTGLDTVTRVWLASGAAVQGATNVVIGIVVVLLCTSIIKQNPFRGALLRGINLTGAAVIVGGLGWQICDAVAGSRASAQVLRATGWSLDTAEVDWTDVRQVIGLPNEGYGWTLDFWPIWVGLALFVVAVVFRYGRTLQNDTDGLV